MYVDLLNFAIIAICCFMCFLKLTAVEVFEVVGGEDSCRRLQRERHGGLDLTLVQRNFSVSADCCLQLLCALAYDKVS